MLVCKLGKFSGLRLLLTFASFALCVSCIGCGYNYETGGGKPSGAPGSDTPSIQASSSEAEAANAASAKEPVIEASGWWAKDSFVHYGIKVVNPNNNLVARDTQVQVVLYDEAGNVAFEDTHIIHEIGPNATIGFTGTSGDGWAPASVDISLVKGSTKWIEGTNYSNPFTIESCEETDKGEFRYELEGEITNNTSDYVSTVDMHTLLIDESGQIVAGYPSEAYKIKAGKTKSYMQTISSAPDHASVEIYAQPVG